MSRSCGFTYIKQKNNAILFGFRSLAAIDNKALGQIINENKGKIMFSAGRNPYLSYMQKDETIQKSIENIKIILQSILKLQSLS